MSTSWRSCIIRIGERCPEYGGQTDPEEHLDTCYNAIVRDLRDSEHDILDVLLQCIMELPHKGPLYGALIGLLNVEDSAFVEKAIKQIHDELQDALDTDNCNKIRILIRFLSVLIGSNVVTPSTVVEVFETLLSSAATTVDDDGGNPAWQPRADFYILCILASLPWCGLELFEHAHEELERVLAAVEAYMSLRDRSIKTSLHPFIVNVEGDGADQDYLDGLWSKTKELADSGWKLESVPRPYLVIEARLATGQNHDFGPLVCPPPPKPCPAFGDHILFGKQWQEAEAKYPHRIGRLRIFPSSKFDEKMTPMDAFVVEEYLLDVLFYLNGCRKECAAYMVGLPVPFRYEYLMAEVIFSQLLLLPKPPFKLIYYTIVMIDLCKALPGAFPAVVAGAVRNLFNRVGEMDVECQDRLIQWISHHLSNFQFVWPWEEWAHVLDQPKWSPQRVFAQEVLEREVRLSYWDKIKQSLQSTPKLIELLPPKNVPNFKFGNKVEGLESAYLLSGDLISMVKAKKSIRDMQLWLQAQVLSSHDQKTAIDILVQTLLHVGSKSFTHMVTVMERYGQLISKIATDQSSQVTVIETVASFWQNSVQMTAIVIDRMMGYRLVSNLAIVKWVFSAVNMQTFHTSDKVWEVLRNAISKTVNRTLDLRKDITKAKVVLGEAHATLERAQTHLLSLQAMETEDPRSLKMERAKSQFERAKDAESTARDGYETKEVLLERALREQEELFICVIKNFVAVITSDLSNSVFTEDLNDALPGDDDFMEVDLEKPSHEADDSNLETDERRNLKYDRSRNGHKGRSREEERAQWRCCTLGHLQSLSRQYAAELWLIMQRLDAEILTSNVDPCILKAVYSGLHRKE